MPYRADSAYRASGFFRNGHFSTIHSGAFSHTAPPLYYREKLTLPDGDFLLLDVAFKNTKKAIILCHGLEGSSQSSYNNRAAACFGARGYSVFAWNNRSCGGEMNPGIRLYHHGETQDLAFVVDYVLNSGFEQVYLMGFSMGGVQLMNYLGKHHTDERVKAAAAISVPFSLKSSTARMKKGLSRIYMSRFVRKIKPKAVRKAQRYPDLLDIEKIKTIHDFDSLAQHFILPVYGYKSLNDFYEQASPSVSMQQVHIPLWVLNACDDPIIGAGGFPVDAARKHRFLTLETPQHGGHCGFQLKNSPYTYAETGALAYFEMLPLS